jgi:UDP-glucuronate 4-epimerase
LLLQNKPIPRFGDGSTSRDYTYIDDIVEGVIASFDRLDGYHVYNLGESDRVPLSRLIELLGEALGVTPVIEELPRQPGDVSHTNAAIQRACAELGYAPKVRIEEGIRRFAQWFVERPYLYEESS